MKLELVGQQELGELFSALETPRTARKGHPGLGLLGKMIGMDLDKTTGRNVAEHVRGCGHCMGLSAELVRLAAQVAEDRAAIHQELKLKVRLVDAMRSQFRNWN